MGKRFSLRLRVVDQDLENWIIKLRRSCYLKAHEFCRIQLVNSVKCNKMLRSLKETS